MIEIKKAFDMSSTQLDLPNYDPKTLKPGMAHIGVGNFFRAHQAYYTNMLLNLNEEQQDWGIVAIGITHSGRTMSQKFGQQDHNYTLTEYSPNGDSSTQVIGAITDYIAAIDDPEKAILQLSDPAIKIVSLTITEGGYNTDENGHFDLNDKDIQHDLAYPNAPKTAFGYIVEALYRRKKNNIVPFTILSCDNLQHNGDVACNAFVSFAAARDKSLSEWIKKHVAFPNSMVDRITPSVDQKDRLRLNAESGINDVIPVYAENFTQWVIEDNFSAGRPHWEMAGVKFVQDVTPYENLKLRFLNASHTMLAYPAFLAGYRAVDEAMKDTLLHNYLRDFMDKDASFLIDIPSDVDIEKYKETLLERFSNEAVSDQLTRLCFHGGAKIPVFVLPTLAALIAAKKDTSRIAYLIAAYGHYLTMQKDDDGNDFEVDAPKLTDEDWRIIRGNDVKDFLTISPFSGFNLLNDDFFVNSYIKYRNEIAANGALATLSKIALI